MVRLAPILVLGLLGVAVSTLVACQAVEDDSESSDDAISAGYGSSGYGYGYSSSSGGGGSSSGGGEE